MKYFLFASLLLSAVSFAVPSYAGGNDAELTYKNLARSFPYLTAELQALRDFAPYLEVQDENVVKLLGTQLEGEMRQIVALSGFYESSKSLHSKAAFVAWTKNVMSTKKQVQETNLAIEKLNQEIGHISATYITQQVLEASVRGLIETVGLD